MTNTAIYLIPNETDDALSEIIREGITFSRQGKPYNRALVRAAASEIAKHEKDEAIKLKETK